MTPIARWRVIVGCRADDGGDCEARSRRKADGGQ